MASPNSIIGCPCIHGDSDANGWLALWARTVTQGLDSSLVTSAMSLRRKVWLLMRIGIFAPPEDHRIAIDAEIYIKFVIRCNHTSWNHHILAV